MGEIEYIIDALKYIIKIPSEIKKSFDAKDSIVLANRHYQKGIIDLALTSINNAIEKNKDDNYTVSRLNILKGDLLTEKGMKFYQSKVECANIFKRSIEAFNEVTKLDPLDSVAWLGKSFSYMMIGLIYTNDEKNELMSNYYFNQSICSAEAGLGSIEENGSNAEIESNLWGLKGGVYYLIGEDERGDKCFEKAGIPKTEIKV
jgi:hypothetical protein